MGMLVSVSFEHILINPISFVGKSNSVRMLHNISLLTVS